MVNILWVAATIAESEPVRQHLNFAATSNGLFTVRWQECEVHLVHTGIGMVNTAYSLGKYLALHQPDHALQFGIAGSFDRSFPLGAVVEVVEDTFSELGAENRGEFLNLEEMGFALMNLPGGKTYYNTLSNPLPSSLGLPKVTGITVNTVHGTANTIKMASQQWNKQVETMEGAAFFHAMLTEGIPFTALRGISNYVEPRNRAFWQIEPAVKQVNEAAMEWLTSLS
ncbi:MAG: futalosine hydrolase [Bacteroidota bacterium]